jgi:hypothetical protein
MNSWQTGFNLKDSLLPSSGTGKKPMAFGFDDALLGAGMLGQGVFGMIGAQRQAETQASIANAQMAAQADAIRQSREMAKGQLGMGMFNTAFGATTAPDIEFGRQLAARRAEFAEFMPEQMGLGREQARWQAAFETSPDVLEANRRERLGRMQETIRWLHGTTNGNVWSN